MFQKGDFQDDSVFPPDDPGRVKYSIEIIHKVLVLRGGVFPSAQIPLRLYTFSNNSDVVGYLWTAARVFGIDHDAIKTYVDWCNSESAFGTKDDNSGFLSFYEYDENHYKFNRIVSRPSVSLPYMDFRSTSLYERKFKHYMPTNMAKWLADEKRKILEEKDLPENVLRQSEYKKLQVKLTRIREDKARKAMVVPQSRGMLWDIADISSTSTKWISDRLKYADINYQDEEGCTALMMAVDGQKDNVVKYLLNRGADPFLRNKVGKSARDFAAHQSPVFDLIKERERALELDRMLPRERYSNLLLDHIREADVRAQKIDEYLRLGADIDYQDENGYTALMLAVDKDNERIADYLFRAGADPLLVNKYGKTAIDLASPTSSIYSAMKQCDLYLLPLNRGYSILLHEHICSSPVKTQKIEEYIALGADINYQNGKGFTVLMLALVNENERIAEYLLRCGSDPLLRNKDGKIASDLVSRNAGIYRILKGYELLFSVIIDDLPTIKTILKFDKNLIDFQGQSGYTPVLIAVEQNAVELVKYLLSQGANLSITCYNEQGVFDLVTNNDMQKLLQLAHDSNEFQADDSEGSLSSSRSNQPRFFNDHEVKRRPESASANIEVAPLRDDDKGDDVVEDIQDLVNQNPSVSGNESDVDLQKVPPAHADSTSAFCSSVENRQGQMPTDPDLDEEWEYVLVDEEEASSHNESSKVAGNSSDEYSTGAEEEGSAEEPEGVGVHASGC